MVRPGSDRLSGSVDVDEAYWGSEEEGVIGRQAEAKALIAVGVESTGGKIGRIRLKRISLMQAVNRCMDLLRR